MRKWLNEDFYNEAFSSSEQAAIMETKVVNKDNPEYGTAEGDDTTDRKYLLSMDEVLNMEYGFWEWSSISSHTATRESNNTDYAKCKNVPSSSEGNVTNKDDGISAPTTTAGGVTTWDCVYLGNYKQTAEWKKKEMKIA